MPYKSITLDRILSVTERNFNIFNPNLFWKDIVNSTKQLSPFSIKRKVQIKIDIHPTESGNIIINCPGYDEDLAGPNNKYIKLAEKLQSENIGTVIRMGNSILPEHNYSRFVCNNLDHVIQYALHNSEKICNTRKPNIYLMGFSAGAGAVAAIAKNYSEVCKILLIAPSLNVSYRQIKSGLKNYTGDLNIMVGEKDKIVGIRVGYMLSHLATKVNQKRIKIIPNCDHYFSGEHEEEFQKAPIWAFTDHRK